VSLGEMARFGYSPRLATGAVAAGGTLGILIPPSTGFVLYAILTQESIGRLFLAGVIPGIVLTLLFVATIWVLTWANPALGPGGPATGWPEKRRATLGALPVLGLVAITIGGIYLGLFSPVEAAAVGAVLAILWGFATRTLDWTGLVRGFSDAIATTATVMLILIGAHVIGPFLALSQLPALVGETVIGLEIGRLGVLALILLAYLVLGCFLEGFAMLVLTMPIFFPVITALGFDPIWFGVVVVLTLEMGLITPPVGVNVFIVKSVAPDVPLREIFAGVAPFLVAMILMVLLLVALPELALFLPRTMIG
jgi:tripartite ATP-independent transporter DctM subunit